MPDGATLSSGSPTLSSSAWLLQSSLTVASTSPQRTEVLVTKLNGLVVVGKRLCDVLTLGHLVSAKCGDGHLLPHRQLFGNLLDRLCPAKMDVEGGTSPIRIA